MKTLLLALATLVSLPAFAAPRNILPTLMNVSCEGFYRNGPRGEALNKTVNTIDRKWDSTGHTTRLTLAVHYSPNGVELLDTMSVSDAFLANEYGAEPTIEVYGLNQRGETLMIQILETPSDNGHASKIFLNGEELHMRDLRCSVLLAG